MKLKNCHIENFGKLHEFSYKFNDELNIIKENNGWGKTTFAVFIKAMFYGLDYSPKKGISGSERKKYLPWNGGRFGGSLDFCVHNLNYRVERFFGENVNDDSFKLYNLDTGLESTDFSENIGEEIFLIDKESFERSNYIPQSDIEINVTDSINAKISNLAENVNDISNSDAALETLEARKKEYKRNNKKGRIYELEERINELNQKLENCINKEKRIDELSEKIFEQRLIKNKYQLAKAELKEKIRKKSSFMEKQAKFEHYAMLERQLEEAKTIQKELEEFFTRHYPQDDEFMIITEEIRKISEYRLILNENPKNNGDEDRLMFLQEFFDEGVPSEEELSKCRDLVEQKKILDSQLENEKFGNEDIDRLENLKSFFENGKPDLEVINGFMEDYTMAEELEKEIVSKKAKVEVLRNVETPEVNERISGYIQRERIAFGIGIIFILVGSIAMFMKMSNAFLPMIGGIVLIIYSMVTDASKRGRIKLQNELDYSNAEKELMTLLDKKQTLELPYIEFVERYPIVDATANIPHSLSEIKTKLAEYENLTERFLESEEKRKEVIKNQANVIMDIESVLRYYAEKSNMSDYGAVLNQVVDYRKEFFELGERLKKNKEATQAVTGLKDDVENFFHLYFEEIGEERYEELLAKVRDNKNRLDLARNDVERWEMEKADFELENNVLDGSEILSEEEEDFSESLEHLQVLELEKDHQIAEVDDIISSYRKDVDELSVIAEEKNDIEEELSFVREEKKECEYNYAILDKTIKYLTYAKEQFTSRYLSPMKKGFEKYISIIENDNNYSNKFLMDVNLDISINDDGVIKNRDYMSTGMRDFVSICIRFALIDALYKGEKPFAILDDPFVNFDENKMANVKNLLTKISKDYQIIYFTCHDSRSL
ncbi:Uncharacterized protein YhaN [Acetitomaculum ruminis DSM 5522]|uniref:Uncharacterized protein YhaN n=1 Tax=Acetitomaculum ruminis DSM 5522 TaxID=1120918 RepID=A0A1I0W3W1_9FIRM|nr:AAA family ATPase [Acetitomaculum ruminis]SFA83419.1 Uncharacterized protein YhaN [Acetitomaculum ruminis DSM 5522]